MPLAPACPWRWPSGRARRAPPQPRAEWGSQRLRRALGARSLLLPVSERAGLSGRGWPWWSRVFFFLSKAFRQRLAARSPPGAHGSPGGRAPGAGLRGGRCWAEAPGAGAQPQGAASADRGCGRAAPGEPGGKLKRKVYNLAKSRVEGRRSLLLRAPAAEGQVGRTRALPRALTAQGATALPPARRGLKIAHEQPQTRNRAPPPHP